MPEFRGSKNLHVGFPVWAASEYEHATRDYVITLDAAGAKKFRPLAEDYGFREVKSDTSKADDSEE